MIRAEHLTCRFGPLTAVEDVSFTIERGRVAGFLGPNGAGKTTTMRMLAGLQKPTSGRAEVAGHDPQQMPRLAGMALGWLPEGAPAPMEFRISEYLRFRASLFGVSAADRIDEVLEACDLQDVRKRVIGQLSRGYRQRVGLAAAMLHDPPALILDEPSTGLDPVQQEAFRGLVRRLAGTRAVLFSTHQVHDALQLCDDILVIVAGRLRYSGSIENLAQAPGMLRLELKDVDANSLISAIPHAKLCSTQCLEDGWIEVVLDLAEGEAAEIPPVISGLGGRLRLMEAAGESDAAQLHQLLSERAP